MADPKTFTGGCHCGQVRYEVTTALTPVIECNCSICSKKAYLLTFVAPEQFTLVAGGDGLSEYQFNTKRIHHLFCQKCGIESFARGTGPDGKAMVAVNVRCLDGLDVSGLEVTKFNGKDH